MKVILTQGNYCIMASADDMTHEVHMVDRNKMIKRFKGESAWSDAERLHGDLVLADGRG